MSKTRLQQMQDQMVKQFPQEGSRIISHMQKEYDALCEQYKDQPKALVSHTHRNIFPVVVCFHALIQEGLSRQEAAQIANDRFLELMESSKKSIQSALKIPGLYKLMPWLWKTLMPKMFKEDAGFRFQFYPTDKNQVKFDMLACPYHQVCKELDCLELAPTFCATDDLCYGNMHPKLIWNRTKTIARGSELCDFDLYIPKKDQK